MDFETIPDAAAIVADLDRQGFAVVENVLARDAAAAVRRTLWDTAEALERRGVSTHTAIIDRNAANVRVYDLPDHDPAFVDLLTDPAVLGPVNAALAGDVLISNFTANIARPGALSMRIHSDMALVIPAPWHERWALNVIWCLDDVHDANGATRYLPGSHRFTSQAEVPADAEARTLAFAAPAGAMIVMDGRLWHTSGCNVTADEDRAMLFAYYTRSFIRPQANWYEVLRPEVIAGLSDEQRRLFGFGALANVSGSGLVLL